MGLTKKIKYDDNKEAEYWVVTDLHWQIGFNKTICELRCYKDKASYLAGMHNFIPSLHRHYVLDGETSTFAVYKLIKSKKSPDSFFIDAIED